MSKIIVGVSFDCKNDVDHNPPVVHVRFVDSDTHEEGSVILDDSGAGRVFTKDILDRVSLELDTRAKALSVPGTLTAIMNAASDATAQMKRDQSDAQRARDDKAIAEAAHGALVEAIAARQAELDALGVADTASPPVDTISAVAAVLKT